MVVTPEELIELSLQSAPTTGENPSPVGEIFSVAASPARRL